MWPWPKTITTFWSSTPFMCLRISTGHPGLQCSRNQKTKIWSKKVKTTKHLTQGSQLAETPLKNWTLCFLWCDYWYENDPIFLFKILNSTSLQTLQVKLKYFKWNVNKKYAKKRIKTHTYTYTHTKLQLEKVTLF